MLHDLRAAGSGSSLPSSPSSWRSWPQTTIVLGPLAAHYHPGGARRWGLTLAAYSAGSVLGGLVMIRFRPAHILLTATLTVPGLSILLFRVHPAAAAPPAQLTRHRPLGSAAAGRWPVTSPHPSSPQRLSIVAATAAVLLVPDVRHLRRHDADAAKPDRHPGGRHPGNVRRSRHRPCDDPGPAPAPVASRCEPKGLWWVAEETAETFSQGASLLFLRTGA